MRLYLDRFVRATRLDVALYKEVLADPKMLNQALNFESPYRAAAACIIAWIISAFVQLTLLVVLLQAFGIEKP